MQLPDLKLVLKIGCCGRGGPRSLRIAVDPRIIMPHMEPADSIRRLGFARWYERRLIEGHAWFASVFFCMIAIAACMEELSFRGSIARLLVYVTVVLAAAAIGIYGMIRYQKILAEAERLGEHATCRACGAYARFKLISPSQVRCRKCDNEWRLIDTD
jgi:hypothetical protein